MNRLKHGIIVLAAVLLVTVGRAEQEKAELGLYFSLDLVDGSRVIGVPSIKSISVQTSYAKMDIPLRRIAGIRIDDNHETASIDLRNGDKLTGVLTLEPLELDTIFGVISVRIDLINNIQKSMPHHLNVAAASRGAKATAPESASALNDGNRTEPGPSVVEGLR